MALIGTITVTSAGTAVQSGTSGTVRGIMWRARADNTGIVYVGYSAVSSSNGVAISPGDAFTVLFDGYERLEKWYADAATNSDKVDFVADNS
jgi:hypothetical protein